MADATKLSAGERAFTAWAASSRADATPLMWTWQEMPQNQRDRWETIALAASPPAREEAPAEGAGDAGLANDIAAILDENADADEDGLHNSSQLAEKIRQYLRARTSEPAGFVAVPLGELQRAEEEAVKEKAWGTGSLLATIIAHVRTHPAPASADKLKVAVEALERIAFTPEGKDGLSLHECVSSARQALAALNEQSQ